MTRFFTPYIYILFFIVFSNGLFSQELTLKIASKDSLESRFLKDLNFKKKHSSEEKIYNEINLISERLKLTGYFQNSIESISKKDSTYTSYFSLGKKIEKAHITLPSEEINIKNYDVKNGKVKIEIENLTDFMNSISKELDNQGKSFSEVKLKNIILKENTLIAELFIFKDKQRTIDRVIIKGYNHFPSSYVKHYLNIGKKTIFNQKKLKDISTAIASLNFVSEIKPPEVLFSKDSTLLYIYLKKNSVNNFDGLVNFASKENGKGLLFNGHLDLKLNNTLHTGEQFELFWKANGEERQQFRISTQLPYIFNSTFTPDISFNIYKQDSTFLNTKFHSGLNYSLNSKTSIGITFDSETSNNTLQNSTNSINVKDFSNSFIGFQFLYKIINNDVFFNDKFLLKINPSFGNRRTPKDSKVSQFKIDIETNYLWQFSRRNSIFIKNKTGYLNSNSFIENELYRIGGANSIRGFNEQSIFTSKFSYFNLEYRYSTSNNSYLYSITDFGRIKTLNSNSKNLYGLGLGYLFRTNNSQINLGYVLGKTSDQNFDLQNSKILIQYLSFF